MRMQNRLEKVEAEAGGLIPLEEVELLITGLQKLIAENVQDKDARERSSAALDTFVLNVTSREDIYRLVGEVVEVLNRTIKDPKDRARFLAAVEELASEQQKTT